MVPLITVTVMRDSRIVDDTISAGAPVQPSSTRSALRTLIARIARMVTQPP